MRYPDGPRSGGAPTAAQERPRLVADVVRYLRDWEQVLGRGLDASRPQIAALQPIAQALEARARGFGFGGLGHHLGECQRAVHAGANAQQLRAQLATVSELAWQARQELSPPEQALVDQLSAAAPAAPGPVAGSAEMMPPRMVTVLRQPGFGAAPAAGPSDPNLPRSLLASAAGAPSPVPPPPISLPTPQPIGLPPAAPGFGGGPQGTVPQMAPAGLTPLGVAAPAALPPLGAAAPGLPDLPPLGVSGPMVPQPGPTPAYVHQPPPPQPMPAAPPAPAPGGGPQFAVRTMFRLRGLGGGDKSPSRAPAPPPPGGTPSLLGLRSISSDGGPAPPPLVHDASGLPPLGELGGGSRSPSASSSQDMQQIFDRLGRASTGSGRARSGARLKTPKAKRNTPHARGRGQSSFGGWWLGLAAVIGLGLLGIVAFLTLGGSKTPKAELPRPGEPAARTDATSSASAAAPAAAAEAPREKLLADDERFKALLAQVHGRGGKESPELRALLNDQAALASKALTTKCADSDPECATWKATRDLLAGNKLPRAIKKRTPRPADQRASRWLAGLKLPNIPVEDDPRVQKVFEYYSGSQIGRETFQSMLFRCGAYRDLIMSTLIRYEMPSDLLAVVFTESGCEPQAKSPVGAAGLWQFMPDTARAYRLRVKEGVVDERYSPFKSTEAGVRFLADLHQKLGSWDLVFASYNMGPFGLMARIERAGGDVGFWDLVDADLLPDETSNYAPTVQAFALILNNLQTLRFAGIQMRAPQLTADLEVPSGTSLTLVARAAATSASFIRTLNLDIVGHEVPNLPGGKFIMQVPKDSVWQARDTLQELIKSGDRSDMCVPPTFDWGKQRFTQEMATACRRSLGSAAASPPAATP